MVFNGKKSRKRKGMTMMEMLGVMIVIGILYSIAIGGVSAMRDNANVSSVVSDMRTFENSMRQMLMLHPEVMKFRVDKTTNPTEKIVSYLNDQMEDNWSFELMPGGADGTGGTNVKHGAIATTTMKRDAWGNPYCLYAYFDDNATDYEGKVPGKALVDSDSCVYFVIVSAGKNGTGVGLGYDGNNFVEETKKILSHSLCINNTDGIDDIGIIFRVLNGDVYSATFGTDRSMLGELKDVQWYFGIPDADSGGTFFDFTTNQAVAVTTATKGGSLDHFYDSSVISSVEGLKTVGGTDFYTTTSGGGGGGGT